MSDQDSPDPQAKTGVVTGLELATRAAIDQARRDGLAMVSGQLPLLPSEAVKNLDAAIGSKGPGRPKGSRNRRTMMNLQLMEASGYRNPMVFLAEIRSRPSELLAKELGCTRTRAAELQIQAAIAELPYWNQKLPQAVDLDITDNRGGDQRSDDEIRARIRELARQHGVTLDLVDVTPKPALPKPEGKQ